MGKIKFYWNKDTAILLGKKQWGKSSATKELISLIPKENIIILDTNREYHGFPNRWKPMEFTPAELDRFIVYCRGFKNKLLIIEDIDAYLTSAYPTIELKNFLINASHQDLGLIVSVKRPLGIPRLLMTEAIHAFYGRFDLKNEREYIDDCVNSKGEIEKLRRFQFWYRNNDTNEEFLFETKP